MKIKYFLDFDIVDVPEKELQKPLFWGKNEKGILIIVEQSAEQEALNAFVEKILAAVQLDLYRDALLLALTPDDRVSFAALCQTYDIRYCINFGIADRRMGLGFLWKPYQSLLHEGRYFLLADALPMIYEERQQGGKAMSGALWRALQQIFKTNGL